MDWQADCVFATVLHNLKSPENVGIIVRTHVALGGGPLLVVGPKPWRFKKRIQAFSRSLEKICEITHLTTDEELFSWCDTQDYEPIAIEIQPNPVYLASFRFPPRPAIIVGSEGVGLPQNVLDRCSGVATIPQFGPVACLNVAVSCSIALYELNRTRLVSREIGCSEYTVLDSERPAASPSKQNA